MTERQLLALFLAAVVLVIGLGWLIYVRKREGWERFKAEHGCKAIQVAPRTYVGFDWEGNAVLTTLSDNDYAVWLCDDVKMYWR